MRIPAWRLALTGGAIVILGVAAVGLASAGDRPAANAEPATATEPRPDGARERERPRDHPRFLRNVVHAVITLDTREDGLITIQLDRGEVTAVDGDSLTIAEATGSSVTVVLDDDTRVRVGRERGSLDDIDVGDVVFVQSRVDGAVLAKRVVIIPAD